LEAIFKHQVPFDPFGDFCTSDDDDHGDDEGDTKVIEDIMTIEYPSTSGYKQPPLSIEVSMALI
jgi:hypothetical protein